MNALFHKLILALALSPLIGCRTFFFFGSGTYYSDNLRRAEESTRQEKFDDAIDAYRRHINDRLAVKDRPDWENPWFYLLLIGDLQLQKGDVEAALASYQEAEKKEIDKGLVSDRYRSIATWYEKKDKLHEAINLLGAYRERDPLIFDAMLDRLSRELTVREDLAGGPALPPPM